MEMEYFLINSLIRIFSSVANIIEIFYVILSPLNLFLFTYHTGTRTIQEFYPHISSSRLSFSRFKDSYDCLCESRTIQCRGNFLFIKFCCQSKND